jgi:hypothetical protein
MKEQIPYIILAIALSIIPQFAYAQTQSYPTDEDLQKLMPDFQSQVDHWSQYEEPERQTEAKTFAENWSSRDPNIASFLGKWAAIEETMNIYPSTTAGQVCIIHTSQPEVSLSLGNVFNQQIYTDAGQVIIQQGNYAGVTWSNENGTGIYVYRLIAPIEVPTREFFSYWDHGSSVLEQFNAAGCIAEATNF